MMMGVAVNEMFNVVGGVKVAGEVEVRSRGFGACR